MRIDRVELACSDIDAGGAWFRDVLGLPTAVGGGVAEITVGTSTLVLHRGPAPDAEHAHHLAFSVPSDRIEAARDRLAGRTTLMERDGGTLLDGPPGWNARSVYFRGPDDAILELIAREALDNANGEDGPFAPEEILDISEVAFGADDVDETVDRIRASTGLPLFTPVQDEFVPIGDQHGLLIVTGRDRPLMPTRDTFLARTPVSATIEAPYGAMVSPTPESMLVSVTDRSAVAHP